MKRKPRTFLEKLIRMRSEYRVAMINQRKEIDRRYRVYGHAEDDAQVFRSYELAQAYYTISAIISEYKKFNGKLRR